MSKIIACAAREYRSTVLTKGFIIGVFALPVVAVTAILLATSSNLLKGEKPPTSGEVVVIDATPGSVVAEGLRSYFSPEGQAARAEEQRARLDEVLDESPVAVPESQREQITSQLPTGSEFDVTLSVLDPSTADPERQKQRVLEEGGAVMLVTVAPDALEPRPADAEAEPTVRVSHRKDVDPKRVSLVRSEVSDIIVDERVRRAGFDPDEIDALRARPEIETTTITASGESETNEAVAYLMPMGFFLLIWMGVMVGGQYLLMSTIEEKSSRVMEVLLSGISPIQLMTGKILGQGAVGLTLLAIYGGIGLFAMDQFALVEIIPVHLFAYLVIYFIMGYFIFGAVYAAVGAAVSDIREAQNLIGPLMALIMIPLVLWPAIVDNPTGLLARVASFIPPLTPFIMVLRLCQPAAVIPPWEIAAATLVGFAGVAVLVWAAAKIFRIGVLMYGKPPSFIGLIKWVRYG